MRARPLRPLLIALVLAGTIAGCGKSPPVASTHDAIAIAPVNPHGAAGLATKNTTRLGGADPATDAAAVALTVNPGLTPAERPAAVVLVNEHDWPAALAASALASAPLHAPLLYADGNTLPQVSQQALATMQPTGTQLLGSAHTQIIQIGTSAGPPSYRSRTLPSTDPYSQAAAIEQLVSHVHPGPERQVIVVAIDAPPAQAMPAAGLAAQTGAPILFVNATGVPAATRAVLIHLHKPAIYAVGSPAALSSAVLDELKRFGAAKRIVSPVSRFAGQDPVDNAIAISLFTDGTFGWGIDEPGHGLVFANLARPLDAPAAAPLSASGDYGPLLLLETPYGVPRTLSEYLSDIQPAYSSAPAYQADRGSYNHGWLIGDEAAISATTQAEIDAMLEIKPVSSVATNAAAPESESEPATSSSTTTTSATPVTPTTATGTTSPANRPSTTPTAKP